MRARSRQREDAGFQKKNILEVRGKQRNVVDKVESFDQIVGLRIVSLRINRCEPI